MKKYPILIKSIRLAGLSLAAQFSLTSAQAETTNQLTFRKTTGDYQVVSWQANNMSPQSVKSMTWEGDVDFLDSTWTNVNSGAKEFHSKVLRQDLIGAGYTINNRKIQCRWGSWFSNNTYGKPQIMIETFVQSESSGTWSPDEELNIWEYRRNLTPSQVHGQLLHEGYVQIGKIRRHGADYKMYKRQDSTIKRFRAIRQSWRTSGTINVHSFWRWIRNQNEVAGNRYYRHVGIVLNAKGPSGGRWRMNNPRITVTTN